jgi:hypothetical protein
MIVTTERVGSNNGEVQHAPHVLSEFDQRLRVLEYTVQLLVVRTSIGDFWPQGFRDVEDRLAALPLPTDEFALANCHLQNAANYCRQSEYGAATFEVRALRGILQRL